MERYRTWVAPFVILCTLLIAVVSLIYIIQNDAARYYLLILIIYYLFQSIIAVTIFCSNRPSSSKQSWLVISLLLPFFGTVIYFVFGRRYVFRKDNEKYLEVNKWWRANQLKSTIGTPSEQNSCLEPIASIVTRNLHASNIDIHFSGEEAYSKLFSQMENAKKSIWIEAYIIKPGEIYENFKSILIDRVKHGVIVRVIIDDFGRWAMPWYTLLELKKAGIQIAIFGQTHFPFIGAENGYRSHRKFVVIDNEIVFTGGLNWSDEYAHFSKKYGYWMDLNFSLTGGVVQDFNMLFLGDWARITGQRLDLNQFQYFPTQEINRKSTVLLVETGPDNTFTYTENSLIHLIHHAKKHVWLATPYFSPSQQLLTALTNAIMRGVDVQIFLPGLPDKKSAYLISIRFATTLQNLGAKIYFLNNMFLHSKVGICDEVGFAGTVNFDMRSIYSQFELECFFVGQASERVIQIFNEYRRLSKLAILPQWNKTKIVNRFLELIINIFLPLS